MFEQTQEQETQQPAVQSTMSAAPKQLAATDILSKMQTGTPLVQGEKLPDVPKGMSAKSFYGQFPGGAAVYSQAPFKQPTYEQVKTTSQPITTAPTTPTIPVTETAPSTEEIDTVEATSDDLGTDFGDMPSSDTSLDQQVDSLLDQVDIGYTIDYDPDLSFTENISREYDEFTSSITSDVFNATDGTVVLDDIEKTLTNVGTRLGTAYDNTVKEGKEAFTSFVDETNEIITDIGGYISDPASIATDTMEYVQKELTEFATQLSNLTDPDKALDAVGYFTETFTKTIASEFIGMGLAKAGLGAAGGPIGMAIVTLVSDINFPNTQIGRPFDSEYEGMMDGGGTIAGYNSQGIAVDANGVMGTINGMYAFASISDFFNNFGKSPSEIQQADEEAMEQAAASDQAANIAAAEEMSAEAREDFSAEEQAAMEAATQAAANKHDEMLDDGYTEEEANKGAAAAAAEAMGMDTDAAADLGAGSPGGGEEGGGGASGPGDGDPKIICTMMNRMYGMGEYRIKQWLLYSDRHLTAEHQLGYHKLYCKLVSMMPSNKIVAKILSHMAEKRTDDIVAEMKHTKRSWLGRTYRTLLIDKPSYIVGWMIKRNWLQPADISILTRKTCNG